MTSTQNFSLADGVRLRIQSTDPSALTTFGAVKAAKQFFINGNLKLSALGNITIQDLEAASADFLFWSPTTNKIGKAPYATVFPSLSLISSGTMLMWTSFTIPNGYLLCDGSEISRTTFSNLFAVIGTIYGSGDGSTTFNIPDMVSRFVRGADPNSIVDNGTRTPNHNVGSLQGSDTDHPVAGSITTGLSNGGSHNHSINIVSRTAVASGPTSLTGGISSLGTLNEVTSSVVATNHSHPISGFSPETRPINVTIKFIIKT